VIEDRIRALIRAYPDWSPAERRKLDVIEDEILDHCRNGTGNGFVRWWCNTWLAPRVPGFVVLPELDAISKPLKVKK
jgi:hypothetical protein